MLHLPTPVASHPAPKLVPPERKWLSATIHEGDAEAVVKEKQEKALAEHIAAHPEHAGLTVRDFFWVVHKIIDGKWEERDGTLKWVRKDGTVVRNQKRNQRVTLTKTQADQGRISQELAQTKAREVLRQHNLALLEKVKGMTPGQKNALKKLQEG